MTNPFNIRMRLITAAAVTVAIAPVILLTIKFMLSLKRDVDSDFAEDGGAALAIFFVFVLGGSFLAGVAYGVAMLVTELLDRYLLTYLLRRADRRARRQAELVAMAKAAENKRIADELAANHDARVFLSSVLDHARFRAHADREAWRSTATAESLPDGDIFALYAKASAYHRMLIREGYERMMDLAHPRHDTHMPLAIAALPPAARLLYLPVAIDATDGPMSYDRLDLDQCDHARRRYVYRSNRKVPDIDHWREQLPAIEAYLGGRWRVARGTGSNIVLTRLPDVAPTFPLEPTVLKPGHAYLGQDLNTGTPVHVAFDKLSHTLVAGPTGMGKSVMLHTLMASVVSNLDRFETVHLVDLKYGLELQDYATLGPKFRLTAAPAEIGPLLTELIAEMDRRGRQMQQARKQNWDGPLILVIIDEFADVLLAEPDKKKREALETGLVRLTNLSRAMGFRFWLQSQKTTADALPTPIRTNLQSILSFRMGTNQAAAMLFGGTEDLPADITLLIPGQAIYRDGRTSETVALQGPLVTFDDVARLLPSHQEAA